MTFSYDLESIISTNLFVPHPSALRSSTLSTPMSLSFDTYTFVWQELWIHICKFTHTHMTGRTPGKVEPSSREGRSSTTSRIRTHSGKYLVITGGTPYRLGYRGRRLYNYHSRPMSEHKACVWQLIVHTTVCMS